MNEQNVKIKTKILSGLFWKFGERIAAQFVTLFVSIVLARLLAPKEYGAVALIMVFITLANVLVSNGFGNALIQKKNADNLDFSSVFYINTLIGIGAYLLLFLFAPYVARFYDMPILCPALRVLALRVPVAAINSIQHAFVSRNMLFKRFFWSTLFGTLVSGIVGVVMAYMGYGIWALVAQYLINTCIDTIVLWFTVRWRPLPQCSWKRAKDLISYGWKLLLSALIDTGYTQIRNLIIGKIYTASDLAYYNQGDKYPQLLVVNVNASISSVLFPAMSQYQDDRIKVKQMTRRAIQVSSYVMWPLMIGLATIAEPLIKLILTEKWLPCVPFLRIFCISYGLWPIHTSNLQAINAMGRSDLFLKLEIIKKAIGIITLAISIHFGPIAIASSLIVSGIISTFINAAPNRRLLEYLYLEQFSDLLPPLVLSLIMSAIICPINKLFSNDILTIILQILTGALVYLMGSILTKQKGFKFILYFFNKNGGKHNQ